MKMNIKIREQASKKMQEAVKVLKEVDEICQCLLEEGDLTNIEYNQGRMTVATEILQATYF